MGWGNLLHSAQRFPQPGFVRARPAWAGTRILVGRSSGFGKGGLTAMEAGAEEYLVKPVLQADLTRVLPNVSSDPAPNGKMAIPTAAGDAIEFKNTGLFKTSFPDDADLRTVGRFWGVRRSMPRPCPATAKTRG